MLERSGFALQAGGPIARIFDLSSANWRVITMVKHLLSAKAFSFGILVVAFVFFLPVGFCPAIQCSSSCGIATCACSCGCPTTVHTAGDQPGDLKVHIVGEDFDTIEAYFKNELFYRETYPKTSYLQCGSNVVLAPANPFGTFAVRFGKHQATVRVYGWKKDQEKPEVKEFTLDPEHSVKLTWITPRILKVGYGPCQANEYIVRFNDADNAWTDLYKTP